MNTFTKLLASVFVFNAIAHAALGQNFTWDTVLVTPVGRQDSPNDIGVSTTGDSYIVGSQHDGVNYDAIITKVSSAGSAQFFARYERTLNDTQSWQNEAFVSVVLSGGSVYALGYQNNGSNNDLVLNKYTTSGSLSWSKVLNDGADEQPANGLVADSSGNLYILFTRTSGGTSSLRMTKYNSSGSRQWIKTFALVGGGLADELAIEPISGSLFGASYSASGYNISKFDTSGTKLWTTTIADTYVREIAVDTNSNVFTFGADAAIKDQMKLRKLNSSGTVQWSFSTSFPAAYVEPMDICTDSAGNVYAAGFYQWSGQFTSVILSLDASGSTRFFNEDASQQYQAYYSLGISSDGYLYAGGYSYPTPGGSVVSTIDKFDSTGAVILRRLTTATNTNYIYEIGFDSSTGVYSYGSDINPISGDTKIRVSKF